MMIILSDSKLNWSFSSCRYKRVDVNEVLSNSHTPVPDWEIKRVESFLCSSVRIFSMLNALSVFDLRSALINEVPAPIQITLSPSFNNFLGINGGTEGATKGSWCIKRLFSKCKILMPSKVGLYVKMYWILPGVFSTTIARIAWLVKGAIDWNFLVVMLKVKRVSVSNSHRCSPPS